MPVIRGLSDMTEVRMATAGDVPMSRVKMNAKHEYEFIANYKLLQNIFKTKKLDKARRSTHDVSVWCRCLSSAYSLFP
jgi:hypothetical protein